MPNRSPITGRIASLLDATPPFHHLSPEQREEILADLTIEFFKPGEVILEQGSNLHKALYIIESGLVRLMEVGLQRLMDMCGEGDTLGSYGLINGWSRPYEAMAVEPTTCVLLPVERFNRLYKVNREFAAFFDNELKQFLRNLGTLTDVTGAHLLFSTRLSSVALPPPSVCTPETTAREAARLMKEGAVDHLVVARGGHPLGIVRAFDLAAGVLAGPMSPDTPVGQLVSGTVPVVGADQPVFAVVTAMVDSRAEHAVIASRGDDGRFVGVIAHHDVSHLLGQDPVATVRRVAEARSLGELSRLRAEANRLYLRLHQQGVRSEDLTHIIAEINEQAVVRVLRFVEDEVSAVEPRPEGLSWCWMQMGSLGRREASLRVHQTSAIAYADLADAGARARAERWLERFAERAVQALAACGFALPEHDRLASDPAWRRPLSSWKAMLDAWIVDGRAPEVEGLPHLLDLRGLYGDAAVAERLKVEIAAALERSGGFLRRLAQKELQERYQKSFFQRFLTDLSTDYRKPFDIHLRGIIPTIDMARVAAMEARYLASSNTFHRLRATGETVPELRHLAERALDAYQYLVDLHLGHQLQAVESADVVDDLFNPAVLNRAQQRLLKAAFDSLEEAQGKIIQRYTEREG